MIDKINIDQPVMFDNSSSQSKGRDDIEGVASEFESLFIYYMLKTMRQGVVKSSLFGDSKGEEIYRSMLDEQLSTAIAESGGIGLKDVITRDLK